MIGQSVRLTTIRGIEIGVHFSWLIVFFLVTLSLAREFAFQHPQWRSGELHVLAAMTSVLFFACILLHELAHSFVALAKGIPVSSITLFVFGGVAQIKREPDRPRTEFQIAIAGPIASALLAAGFQLMAMLTQETVVPVAAAAEQLASINFAIAVFNLVPGFPLDGGRIFRAALWAITGNYARATRIASWSGQGVGYAFIIGGTMMIFSGNWSNGLWIAFIGWFLLHAAQESGLVVAVRSALSGLTAKDIMTQEFLTVPGHLSLAELVENYFLRTGQRCIVVTNHGRLEGLITLHQVKTIPRERWDSATVTSAMTPLARLHIVRPETPILNVLTVMEEGDVNQIPVVTDGQLIGIINRHRLLAVLYSRMEMGAQAA